MGNEQHKKFGLFTAISMIVGIVIGSGIFFKTPEIIKITQGNVIFGTLAFIIGGSCIIFGSLTIINYAKDDNDVGGIITYCEKAWGKNFGYIAGWFQTIFYYPALIAVIAWVSSNYILELFNRDNLIVGGKFNIEIWILTIIILIFFYLINTFKTASADFFQKLALIIKLAALIILSIAGLFYGNPQNLFELNTNFNSNNDITSLFAAIVSVAFACDGWLVAPSISHELKDSRKNLPKALTIAPIIITSIYISYFLAITSFSSSASILAGTDPLKELAIFLFGNIGMKIVYLFVVISILGTINGLILGYIRLPYALALRNELPLSNYLAKVNPKYDIPIIAALFSFIISLIWLFLHFLSLDGAYIYEFNLMKGLEVDNLPIVLTYFFYGALYLAVIIKKKENNNFINRFIIPSFAIIGALLIIYGGVTKPNFNIYLLICLLGIIAGILIKPKKKDIL